MDILEENKRQVFLDSAQHCKKCGHTANQFNFVDEISGRFRCPDCGARGEEIIEASKVFTVDDACEDCGEAIKIQGEPFCKECSEERIRWAEEDLYDFLDDDLSWILFERQTAG